MSENPLIMVLPDVRTPEESAEVLKEAMGVTDDDVNDYLDRMIGTMFVSALPAMAAGEEVVPYMKATIMLGVETGWRLRGLREGWQD